MIGCGHRLLERAYAAPGVRPRHWLKPYSLHRQPFGRDLAGGAVHAHVRHLAQPSADRQVRRLAPAMGSTHRALAAALSLSRVSGVVGGRRPCRLGASLKVLSPAAPTRKWADAGRGASAQGWDQKQHNRTALIIGRCGGVDHPEHMISYARNVQRTQTPDGPPLRRPRAWALKSAIDHSG